MFLKLLSKGTQGKKVKQSQKANDKLRKIFDNIMTEKGLIAFIYKERSIRKIQTL